MDVELITSNLANTLHAEVSPDKLSTLTSVDIAYSYIKQTGVQVLRNVFEKLHNARIPLRIVTTLQLAITEVEALQSLAEIGAEIKIFKGNNRTFHIKGWLFSHTDGTDVAIVGSSNISRSALTTSLEWNVQYRNGRSLPRDKMVQTFRDTFDAFWVDSDDRAWETYNLEKFEELLGAREIGPPLPSPNDVNTRSRIESLSDSTVLAAPISETRMTAVEIVSSEQLRKLNSEQTCVLMSTILENNNNNEDENTKLQATAVCNKTPKI